ncbi:MAG: 16S rRNA (guanine(527)-N(7))-methyltransferase RsmG [Dehalococcoidales bacterium]
MVMEKLAAGLEKLGIKTGERELALFQIYYEELTDWNQRMNLTAIIEYEKVQILHFLDSLTVAAVWRPTASKPHPKVIDIGTGAGVPGIPLKIVFPQIRLTLMDSTNKKITFLNHLKQKLGLDDIEVISGRAEELAHQQYRESYDLVLARGLAPMPTLAEVTIPFCKIAGKAVLHKKGDIAEEMNKAKRAISTMGGKLIEIKPVELSEFPDNRVLVMIEKLAPTPEIYPRGQGLPVKRPLG